MIKQSDSLAYLKTLSDYSQDILYCDPPYALGSEIIIRKDGKVDYKKASDFMSKWEMPTGAYWEQWFAEAYRVLKHGGWLIMFGMDRQLLLFKYYAHLAEFQEQQSLYWYFISNFPKATDLSKMIDKNAGAEREVVSQSTDRRNDGTNYELGMTGNIVSNKPISDLAKKYDGYKYSISPLKQTNETIMVFKKPTKTGSVLHDTLAYEKGDKTITVGALNIDGNRVGTNDVYDIRHYQSEDCFQNLKPKESQFLIKPQPDGRYPAQTFIDSQVAEVLDKQSGVSGGTERKGFPGGSTFGGAEMKDIEGQWYGDIGGCSKILNKCDYTQEDIDLYYYEPKVSSSERNAGCDELSLGQYSHDGRDKPIENPYQRNDSVARNTHPTLKPIELNYRILSLFKTPNDQTICYAFAGAGSEIIGGIKAGFENWHGCEINQEYVDIANARIKYWQETMTTQVSLFEL